jgi:hypothetical protein
MRRLAILLALLLLPLGFTSGPAQAATGKRVVVYYQTQYNGTTYVSPLGLTDNNTGVTDLLVGALHLDTNSVVHLNDDPPGASKFDQMWRDLAAMQAKGVHVSVMVGGAAQGTFGRLDTDFATYYPLLKNVITTYHLDGVDLDVEETMSLAGIERLIDQLRTDFGSGFVITLAPVAPALSGGGNLSGFSYDSLVRDRGSSISWFNAQFYCGWGSLADTNDYDAIINHGLVTPDEVVAGALTNSANCGSGYVPLATLKSTLSSLVAKYPNFGGVAGWEYFNSDPGGTAAPWQWAAEMTSAMSGGSSGGGTLGNGGFESGSLTGWTTSGTAAVISSGAHSGSYAALLGASPGPTNGDSSLTQSFTAPSGSSQLSFWYSVTCPDSVSYDWATATLADTTAGSTVTPLAKTCTNGQGWQQVTTPVTAGHNYRLTLTNHDDNYSGDGTATAFDDVTFGGATGSPNLALNRPATGSASCSSTETPDKAVNGSVSGGLSDKFCSLAATKWLQVDLGGAKTISSFTVRHAGAGGESTSYNTKAFTIQTSPDGATWTTQVTVTANTANVTTHPITATTARYVKLNVSVPTQTTDPATRIYEFEVY